MKSRHAGRASKPTPAGSGRKPEMIPAKPAPTSRSKLWAFRLLPFFLLLTGILALEGGFRLAGVGHPAAFFIRASQQGGDRWVENMRFGWTYFPKHISRSPQPISIPVSKPPGNLRVFVLGESAALGDPKPAFGMPRMLQVMLEQAMPGTRIEVVNAAMTAINSHVIREIANESARLEGDVWVVYAGNNEVIGPFGGGTIFGSQAPPRSVIAANRIWTTSRTGQAWESWRSQSAPAADEQGAWAGLEMFREHQLPWTDPRLRTVHQHFRANLDHIIRRGVASGAKVVLATVASNLRDCSPFASALPAGMPPEEVRLWESDYHGGTDAEAGGDPGKAWEHFQRADKLQPAHADLQFRMGRILAARGENGEAAKRLGLARDLDLLRFRTDSVQNDIIRSLAAQHHPKGVRFVDVERRLTSDPADPIPGRRLFLEHVHLTFEGNHALASLLVPEILGAVRTGSPPPPAVPLPSQEQCAELLGFTDWDRLQTLREIQGRMQGPPFTGQSHHAEDMASLQSRMEALRGALEMPALKVAANRLENAVRRRPGDWVLRDQQGKLLMAGGDLAGAVAAWRKVGELMPHFVNAPYQIGNALDSHGRSTEAEPFFHQALALMPHFVEAMNGLGLCLAAQKRHDEAAVWYARAIQWRPGFATAHVNWGISLVAQKQPTKAVAHYEAALRIRPADANTHYNMAVAMRDLHRTGDQIMHLQKAVALNPQFLEARYNLASELARQGNLEPALKEYNETVRRWPRIADARHGLAAVLARLGQIERAAEEAKAALQLNPDHAGARQLLQQIGASGRP